MNSVQVGRESEELCARYVEKCGYSILERNYYIVGGEIDIIARKGDGITFFEVKKVTPGKYSHLTGKVPVSKQRKMMKSAKLYLKRENINPYDVGLQFDLLAVTGEEIEHIENIIIENEV